MDLAAEFGTVAMVVNIHSIMGTHHEMVRRVFRRGRRVTMRMRTRVLHVVSYVSCMSDFAAL
jgi:hypothetical protein